MNARRGRSLGPVLAYRFPRRFFGFRVRNRFFFFLLFSRSFGRNFSKFSNAVSFDSFNGDMIKYVQVVHV